jgi:hypothetical protein
MQIHGISGKLFNAASVSLILMGYLDPRLRRSCRGSGPLDLSLPTLPLCPKKAGTRIAKAKLR